MRRFLRYAAISVVVLCLAAWCLSLKFTIGGSIGSLGLCLHEGRIFGGWWPGAKLLTSYSHDWARIFTRGPGLPGFFETRVHWGFDFYLNSGAIVAYIPLWCPFLLFSLLVAAIHRRSRKPGSCRKCGYATIGFTKCPECGTGNPE